MAKPAFEKSPQNRQAKAGEDRAATSVAQWDNIRAGFRAIMQKKYTTVLRAHLSETNELKADDAQALIKEFERNVYNLFVAHWTRGGNKGDSKGEYPRFVNAANLALAHSPGPFPDEPLALRLYQKTVSPKDAATDKILFDHEVQDPRATCRKMFVGSLIRDARLKTDRARALDIATRIEASCFHAAIVASKNSEDPYRRHWGSEPFVAVYSGRCATVNSHIDPLGSVCRAYGQELMDKILAGSIAPDDVGAMTAAQMCPEATRVEKLEIEIRSQQHVSEKWSDLFACPSCRVRKCTYIEKQTRSLDEPAKILCKCVCGRKFIGG